jgi:hypothetical protein
MNVTETLLKPNSIKTGKTNETYTVGNEEFLLVVFGREQAEARPFMVSFTGNPLRVSSKAWFGRSWQGDLDSTIDLLSTNKNYFQPGKIPT